MSAIVTVRTTTDAAWAAFLDVVQDPAISADELGQNSGIHMVVFSSPNVKLGTGFDTLSRLMEAHTPGSSTGLDRVDFG